MMTPSYYGQCVLGHVSETLLDIISAFCRPSDTSGEALGITRDRCDSGCISCPCPCNIDEAEMVKGTWMEDAICQISGSSRNNVGKMLALLVRSHTFTLALTTRMPPEGKEGWCDRTKALRKLLGGDYSTTAATNLKGRVKEFQIICLTRSFSDYLKLWSCAVDPTFVVENSLSGDSDFV